MTQPSTIQVAVPASLASQLAVYADNQAIMRLVAPEGWQCRADYGADGTGGVAAYPPGVTLPASGTYGWHLPSSSTAEAVSGETTAGCTVCAAGMACAVFTTAARDFQVDLAKPCTPPRPATETVDQLSTTVVSFEDPPGTAGSAWPSGGVNPANGVMNYHSNDSNGSWESTCTLPAAEKQVCTTSLNAFLANYQNQ